MNKYMLTLIGVGSLALFGASGLQAKNQEQESQMANFPCLNASDKSFYQGEFLQNFMMLQEGHEGWLFRNQDMKLTFGPRQQVYKKLHQLTQALQRKGVALVMVPIPTRPLVHPQALGAVNYDVQRGHKSYANYLHKLRRAGAIVPSLEKLYNKPINKPLFFSRDHHWNPRGAQSVARYTAHAIKSSPKYTGLSQYSFESQVLNKYSNHGSLQKAAEQICGERYVKESFKIFQTAPVNDMTNESDLFGDVEAADIVLVGTSNSHGKLHFNFAGFLSQYSKLNVQNLAMSGGGYNGALKRYLSSDEFHQQPPKFLVWEMPSYYSLNDLAFFDEALALVQGEL